MKRALAGALVCLTLGSGMAHAEGFGVLVTIAAETDADHFSAVRARAGGLFDYASPWQYAGVAAQTTTYAQSGWREHATGVVALWRDQSRATLDGITAEVGVVQVGSYTRPVADVAWALRPASGTGVQLLAAAGLVETQAAIEDGIGYSFWGASVEHQVVDAFTVIGLVGYQPFTDGNDRFHFRARAIWDVLPDQGVNLQARWRQYRSEKVDVGGAYFNPERYEQWLGVVGFRKRHAGWTISGAAGAGQEYIHNGNTTTQPTYLAELRAEGPIAGNARLSVQALYNQSAGFSNAPGYWWSSLSASLIVPF